MPIDEPVPRLADDGSLGILRASPPPVHPTWHARGISFPSEVVSGPPDLARISRERTDKTIRDFLGRCH